MGNLRVRANDAEGDLLSVHDATDLAKIGTFLYLALFECVAGKAALGGEQGGAFLGIPLYLGKSDGDVLDAHLADLPLLLHDLIEIHRRFLDRGDHGIVRLGQAGDHDPILLGQFRNNVAKSGVALFRSLQQGS